MQPDMIWCEHGVPRKRFRIRVHPRDSRVELRVEAHVLGGKVSPERRTGGGISRKVGANFRGGD